MGMARSMPIWFSTTLEEHPDDLTSSKTVGSSGELLISRVKVAVPSARGLRRIVLGTDIDTGFAQSASPIRTTHR